jgi:hypothetical protein
MTNRQIEISREIRLWVAQIVVPVTVGVAMVTTNPKLKSALKAKAIKVIDKVRAKLEK